MSALVRAEVRKALAMPSTWWLLLATVAIGVLGTLAPLVASDADQAHHLSDTGLRAAMHGAAAGAILVVVVGIIAVAGDWRFGQATQTFLTTPRRGRALAAKAFTAMGIGAVYGLGAGAGALLAAWSWYRSEGVVLPLDRAAVWLTLAGCLAVAVLFGLLGAAVGAVARNQVVAIVAALAWQVLVEPTLFAAAPAVFRWLPGMASFSLRRQPTEGLLDVGPAAAVLISVIVALGALGTWLVERDDVTGEA